jgi:hypothetical protein
MADDLEEKPPSTICKACASPLDARARLCPVCKTWQKAWRNWLPYLGAIVTAGTVVVSGITYTVTHLRTQPPPQVSLAVLDMTDPGSVSLLNTGNVDLLITDVQAYCKKEIVAGHTENVHMAGGPPATDVGPLLFRTAGTLRPSSSTPSSHDGPLLHKERGHGRGS